MDLLSNPTNAKKIWTGPRMQSLSPTELLRKTKRSTLDKGKGRRPRAYSKRKNQIRRCLNIPNSAPDLLIPLAGATSSSTTLSTTNGWMRTWSILKRRWVRKLRLPSIKATSKSTLHSVLRTRVKPTGCKQVWTLMKSLWSRQACSKRNQLCQAERAFQQNWIVTSL